MSRLPSGGRAKWWLKLGYWVSGLVAAYAMIGFLAVPPIARSVATQQLSQQLNRQVSIERVQFNPFALSAAVRGLQILDKDGQPFVSWDEVYVNLQAVSFVGHDWVLDEVRLTRPFVRVRVNPDYSFNFSDLIRKFSTNAPATNAAAKPKPFGLRIGRLRIAGAGGSFEDLTPHTPFRRQIGPFDITLADFRTAPTNRNPYSVAGTTDAGERIAWSGHFALSPLRAEGQFSLEHLPLNKYAALYQDFVRFQIQDGSVDLQSSYRLELNPTNLLATVTNASFRLSSLKLAEPHAAEPTVELGLFAVTNVSADLSGRKAEIGSISASGGRLIVNRDKEANVNLVEMAKPASAAPQASEAVLLLLKGITNAVSLFLNSTNAWTGTVHEVAVSDCSLSLEDLVNSRPVRLELDQIGFTARHISNLPGTNLTAALSIRWNTNGAIKTDVQASFSPLTVDARLDLSRVELRALDPYLEGKLNVFVLGSKLGLDSRVRLRTAANGLPEISFDGDARLEDFSTVDGVWGEELLKWRSVQVSGIQATLTPPSVNIREVSVDGAYARVVIETNKSINLMAALRLNPTNAAAATAVARSGPQPQASLEPSPASTPATRPALPKISIATVTLSNAAVDFTDRSITPNVSLGIQQVGGTISGLSTETMGHATVQLHAQVDKVGPVEISGLINPLAKDQTNEITLQARNVDLLPTSPYVGKFAGYQLAQGKLQMDLAYNLNGRQLKASNVIVLDRFTFGERVNSPDATKLPVRLAIAILKDRDGKIRLDVPIEGSLDDPQFQLHKVISGAVVHLLTKVATSPFSLLGAVFGGHGEDIRYQDFASGSAEIQPSTRDKLDTLVKGLYERPGLSLEIQGCADPVADREILQRQAFEHALRLAKWHALSESKREELRPDQVPLSSEERAKLVQHLYSQAVAKGQLPAPGVNSQAVNASSTPGSSAMSQPPAIGSKPPRFEHEAQALVWRPAHPQAIAPSTPATGASAAAPASPGEGTTSGFPDEAQMEQRLIGTQMISDSDLQALARRRAEAVRSYILASGKVEPARLFFADTADAEKAHSSRVYLQLR